MVKTIDFVIKSISLELVLAYITLALAFDNNDPNEKIQHCKWYLK